MSYEIEVRLQKWATEDRYEIVSLCMDDSDGIDVAQSRISPRPVEQNVIDAVHALVVENAPQAYQIKAETRSANKAEWFLRDLISSYLGSL